MRPPFLGGEIGGGIEKEGHRGRPRVLGKSVETPVGSPRGADSLIPAAASRPPPRVSLGLLAILS